MAPSTAQTESQGKIKLLLLYGKSNGKERLLPEQRRATAWGVRGCRTGL